MLDELLASATEEPKAPEPTFRLLVADSNPQRADYYRIRGNPAELRVVRSVAALTSELAESKWHLLITSGTLQGYTNDEELLAPIINAHYSGHLEGVIVNASIPVFGEELTKDLLRAGVPARWYPYDARTPSFHYPKAVKL